MVRKVYDYTAGELLFVGTVNMTETKNTGTDLVPIEGLDEYVAAAVQRAELEALGLHVSYLCAEDGVLYTHRAVLEKERQYWQSVVAAQHAAARRCVETCTLTQQLRRDFLC